METILELQLRRVSLWDKLNVLIFGFRFNSEGEIEADWLSEVGLGEFSQQWRQGKSLPENDIGPAVQKLSLKPHQVLSKALIFCMQ